MGNCAAYDFNMKNFSRLTDEDSTDPELRNNKDLGGATRTTKIRELHGAQPQTQGLGYGRFKASKSCISSQI